MFPLNRCIPRGLRPSVAPRFADLEEILQHSWLSLNRCIPRCLTQSVGLLEAAFGRPGGQRQPPGEPEAHRGR